jgi:hypothetical protein
MPSQALALGHPSSTRKGPCARAENSAIATVPLWASRHALARAPCLNRANCAHCARRARPVHGVQVPDHPSTIKRSAPGKPACHQPSVLLTVHRCLSRARCRMPKKPQRPFMDIGTKHPATRWYASSGLRLAGFAGRGPILRTFCSRPLFRCAQLHICSGSNNFGAIHGRKFPPNASVRVGLSR